jgi:N,N'-diacetyllegionaminate synthase
MMTEALHARWCNAAAPVYVIAEAGVNHNGDLGMARQLVDAAAQSGAAAVKFQTFSADSLVSRKAQKAEYQKRALAGGSDSQYEMLKALELSPEAFRELKLYCASKGITFLSTPFCEESADLLDDLDVDAFKVSSGDLTSLQLLAHIARKGRPVIVSTGMATMYEVVEAVDTIKAAGNPPLALMHCVSNYPADPADCNLRSMATMAAATGVPIGWSDHTEGSAVSLAAIALGARLIEKHFTLSRDLPGPDHKASIEPDELADFVTEIRAVESALGSSFKGPTKTEDQMRVVARRSLVARCDISEGTTITQDMVAIQRPGSGIEPKYYDLVIGRVATAAVAADEPIPWRAVTNKALSNGAS